MLFSKSDEFYSVQHISGPAHNHLLIKFKDADGTSDMICKMNLPIGRCDCWPPSIDRALKYVFDGISKANLEFGTNYAVEEMQLFEDDTERESVYGYMVWKLIAYIELGGEFVALKS